MTRRYKIDRLKIRELLEMGLTNLEIADRLGCAPNSVTEWKRQLGFPVLPWKGDGRPKKNNRPAYPMPKPPAMIMGKHGALYPVKKSAPAPKPEPRPARVPPAPYTGAPISLLDAGHRH